MADHCLLFCRLKSLGMNAYLYAPKDDLKHRALWRDLYSPEEIGNFCHTDLIHVSKSVDTAVIDVTCFKVLTTAYC